MKIVVKNASLVFSNIYYGENLIDQSEIASGKYLLASGIIGNATVDGYYVTGKIPFTQSISVNSLYPITEEATMGFASACVYKNSDDTFVRAIQVGSVGSLPGPSTFPQLVFNSETDADTYIIISTRVNLVGNDITKWDARYGSNVPGGYLGT